MLLGTVITDSLTWDRNCEELIKKAYKRMQLLNCVASFTDSRQDLKNVYLTFIRSVLEQSAVVWHSSLTDENRQNLERVQKSALRIILGHNYTSYQSGLNKIGLQLLDERREENCLNFARKCVKNEQLKQMFPLNKQTNMKTRHKETYKVQFAHKDRLQKSPII